ncbi:MAG: universal stress protein [Opitutales bacterium]
MKTILVPVDFSDITPLVLVAAASVARAHHGRMVLLHVLHPMVITATHGLPPDDAAKELTRERDAADHTLTRHAEMLRARNVEVFTEVREGCCVRSILKVAEEQAADWIVLGSHGHGAHYHLPAGGTVEGILREARCPVLVIPPKFRNSRARGELEDSAIFPHVSRAERNKPAAAHGLFANVKGGTHRAPPKAGT